MREKNNILIKFIRVKLNDRYNYNWWEPDRKTLQVW